MPQNPYPKGSTEAAMWDYENAVNDYADTSYDWLGDINLEEIGYTPVLQETDLKQIQANQELNDMELKALKDLEEQANEGLDATDKAELARLESNVNRQHSGRLGAVRQRMADRGLAGSGLDFLSQQQAAQDATEREALAALEKSAQNQQARRDATARMGSLAGQLDEKKFSQEARKAEAQDVINRFNTGNAIDTVRRNTDIRNRELEYNSQGRQGVANRNVDHAGNVMRANTGLAELQYNAAVDAKNREEERKRLERERKAKKVGAIAGLAGAGVGGYLGGPAGATAGQAAGSGLGNAFYAKGGKVPGKASFAGDDVRNDTEQVNVSPGEIIIPRSIAEDPHASAAFVKKTNEQEDAEDAINGLLEAVAYLTKRRK